MEVWQILLYGFAAVLALRSLSGLMIRHRDRLNREQALRDEQQEAEQSQPQPAAKSEAQRANGRAA